MISNKIVCYFILTNEHLTFGLKVMDIHRKTAWDISDGVFELIHRFPQHLREKEKLIMHVFTKEDTTLLGELVNKKMQLINLIPWEEILMCPGLYVIYF